jgi:hypothetical protein
MICGKPSCVSIFSLPSWGFVAADSGADQGKPTSSRLRGALELVPRGVREQPRR